MSHLTLTHIADGISLLKLTPCTLAIVGDASVGQLKLCDFGFARQLPSNNGSITDYVSTRFVACSLHVCLLMIRSYGSSQSYRHALQMPWRPALMQLQTAHQMTQSLLEGLHQQTCHSDTCRPLHVCVTSHVCSLTAHLVLWSAPIHKAASEAPHSASHVPMAAAGM